MDLKVSIQNKIDNYFSEYQSIANEILPNGQIIRSEQNVLVIQPYIRLFGPKRTATRPDIKLLEAEDLIRSLDNWTIQESVKVGLPTFDRNTFFGTGKLAELVKLSRKYNGNTYKEVNGPSKLPFAYRSGV